MSADKQSQAQRRRVLYAAHQRTLDRYWDENGKFVWPVNPDAHGGYRAMLWHCLAYLAGDPRCVDRANRIIISNYTEGRCHFTPGAAVDLLRHHRERLTDEARGKLHRYLELNLSYMSTEDLKIHGYNDNHPFKAMHALVVGGELLGENHWVQVGLHKLRQAVEVYQRNGFPCEYNSPNYSPVSLNPLANIVEQAANAEACELALWIENFVWRDVALHFDAHVGLPAGPFSRAYVNDYSGLLSGIVCLLAHLWPDRFDFDLVEEIYGRGETPPWVDPAVQSQLPFFQAHPVWYASATYHPTEQIERAMFEKPPGACVRGTTESGVFPIAWDNNPQEKPVGAPPAHIAGPRHGLVTTYFGEGFTLGTSQYAWLDNAQTHGFYITVSKADRRRPDAAAVYYARMSYDDHSPYGVQPRSAYCFRDEGEIRTVQHCGTAMVFYNPMPYHARLKSLQTGVYRPMAFSQPRAVFVGETPLPHLNYLGPSMAPIAVDEGEVYVGFIPLRLTNHGLCREAHLHVHAYGNQLAIVMLSFEDWQSREFTYEQILETHAGFVCEVHAAKEFTSFADFRRWLAAAKVEDVYYAKMRTTTYQRDSTESARLKPLEEGEGLRLSASYSPFHSAFRYVSINGHALETPVLQVRGLSL